MLQIKNTLGGGKPEGLYAWKKYEVIPAQYVSNPTITIGKPTSGTYSVGISNPSFDLSNIPIVGSMGDPVGDLQSDDCKHFVDFFDGFKLGDTCYIEKSVYEESRGNSLLYHNNGNTWWLSGFYKNGSSYGFWFKTATANGVAATLTFDGEKELVPAKVGGFVGYVVSDKETAYPDGGVHTDGYYYEKVTDGIDLSVLGCTKVAVDKFTLASDVNIGNSAYSLNHSLGEKAKYAILVSNGNTLSQSIMKMVYMYLGEPKGYQNGAFQYLHSNGSKSLGYFSNVVWTKDCTDDAILIAYSGHNYYLQAGIEYTLVTIA